MDPAIDALQEGYEVYVHRFADAASMYAWESSEMRRKLFEEANQYSTPHYEEETGLKTWFAVPDLHAVVPPAKWKIALVTFFAAYVLAFCLI